MTKAQVIEYLESADLCSMTREKCARALGMHPSTLNSKLKEEDVDFRYLLSIVRQERIAQCETLAEAAERAGLSIDGACKMRQRMRVFDGLGGRYE